MTAPVPEESNEALDLTEEPPGEHDSELSDGTGGDRSADAAQEENAQTSLDQPSS